MRSSFFLLPLIFFFTLHAGEPTLWDVRVDEPDESFRAAFGELDVWSVYRDEDTGLWHYRVAATADEIGRFRTLPATLLRVGPLPIADPLPAGSEYRDADTVLTVLDALQIAYPDRAKLYTIGRTIEGRDIVAIKISADPSQNLPDKHEFLFTGMHHAREWIGVEVTLRIAEFLLEQYDYSERIKDIVDRSEIWIVPMLNEDGYRFSWETTRLWRKNRRDNGNGAFGVDPNRNYDAGWGGAGTSKNPSSDVYCGTGPFSEPETAAVRDILDPANGWMDDPLGFIDFHSYSQLILYPYGHTYETSPREKEMKAITVKMAELIKAETGINYTAQKSSALYVATGGSADWFHLAHEFRNGLTVELRPGGNVQNGFVLPVTQIKDTARENVLATLYFIEATIGETAEIDADANGNGLVDYLEGCGEELCEMLYDREEDPLPDDDPVSDDDPATDEEAADDPETDDQSDPTDQSDQSEISDDTYSPDDMAVVTDTGSTGRRAVSDSGCSVVLF